MQVYLIFVGKGDLMMCPQVIGALFMDKLVKAGLLLPWERVVTSNVILVSKSGSKFKLNWVYRLNPRQYFMRLSIDVFGDPVNFRFNHE